MTRIPPSLTGRVVAGPSTAAGGRVAGVADGAGNKLLAALPRRDADLLRPLLKPSRLEPGAALLEAGREIEQVVFPDSGVVRVAMGQGGPGERAEVGLVGREGLLGLHALLGGGASPFLAVVQVSGEGWTAPVRALRPLVHGSFAFRDLVLRCAAAQIADVAATAVCNALHPLRQRAARWLLAVNDRAGPGFSMTQAALAEMLGARRPTVNAVLQRLKAEGVIHTARGRIAISDAAALEGAACACRRGAVGARNDSLASV